MSETVCLWCFVRHKEGTKIKAKHDRLLQKVREGNIPCVLGQCKTYLCELYQELLRTGLKEVGNCNEVLAMLNTVDVFLEKLKEDGER